MPRRHVAACGAGEATPEQQVGTPLATRGRLKKRIVVKPDGRYLIYYEKS